MAQPGQSKDSTGAALCCECWGRIDGNGVIVKHPYGVAAYHAACYHLAPTTKRPDRHG
jgi:hypothetical protein